MNTAQECQVRINSGIDVQEQNSEYSRMQEAAGLGTKLFAKGLHNVSQI